MIDVFHGIKRFKYGALPCRILLSKLSAFIFWRICDESFQERSLGLRCGFLCFACDDDDDDHDLVYPSTTDGGLSQTCKDVKEFEPCGGDAQGSWKMVDVCGFDSLASEFECNVEDHTRTGVWDNLTIDGSTYKQKGGISVSGSFVAHDNCFEANASCNNASVSEDGLNYSCSGTNAACSCQVSGSWTVSESGKVEVDGSHITLSPTDSTEEYPENTEGDYCVQGDMLIFKVQDFLEDSIHIYTRVKD